MVFAPCDGLSTALRKVAHRRLKFFLLSFQSSKRWRPQFASMRTPLFVRHDVRYCALTRSTSAALVRARSDVNRRVMARDESENFQVRPDRSCGGGTRVNSRTQPFFKQVEIAVRKAGGNPRLIGDRLRSGSGREGGTTGRFNARGRGAKVAAALPRRGRDGGWQRDSAGRFRARRVLVKARVVRLNPPGKGTPGPKMRTAMSRAIDAHLRYLERDGVTRDGERGKAYSALENEVDGKAFVERSRGDRHQFRFIVAAEDGTEMADLRGFTRDLMRQVELDLATRLDWIAVDLTTPAIPTLTSSFVACSMTAASSTSPAIISPMVSVTGPASWSPGNWATRARSSFRQNCKTTWGPSASPGSIRCC